jgi:hypothetical protein
MSAKNYLVIVRLIQQPTGQERKSVHVVAGSVGEARRLALKECAEAGLRVRDILAAGLV